MTAGRLWITIAVGRRSYALWGDGHTDSWAVRDFAKGRVYGVHIGYDATTTR
jgi:hypothetical protein